MMTEEQFKALMAQAKAMADEYSAGYQRGLRRHYHGEKFGTADEHETWNSLTGARGDGYRDGAAGQPPKRQPGRPTTVDGKRRNVFIDDASWERAQKLGNGNASEGIRKALEIAQGISES